MRFRSLSFVFAVVAVLGLWGGGARAAAAEGPEVALYPSAAAALQAVLESGGGGEGGAAARVLAFGEYHEVKGNRGVQSALRRFADELFAVMQPRMSDLVFETWVTEGDCGKKEVAVVKDVAKTTQRPQTTESEIVTLIKQAKAAGVQPHILKLSCTDYQSLLGDSGEVDYEKMLRLLTSSLEKKILEVVKRRDAAGVHKVVAVYGGALHNDLYPAELLRDYTFGPALQKALPGQYVEVDLYVPEFIARDANLKKESWYPLYLKSARPGKTALVRRGDGSYIIVFSRTRG